MPRQKLLRLTNSYDVALSVAGAVPGDPGRRQKLKQAADRMRGARQGLERDSRRFEAQDGRFEDGEATEAHTSRLMDRLTQRRASGRVRVDVDGAGR